MELLADEKTYVYLAGLESVRDELDDLFARFAGSMELWQKKKSALIDAKRWVELLY